LSFSPSYLSRKKPQKTFIGLGVALASKTGVDIFPFDRILHPGTITDCREELLSEGR